MKTRKEAIMGFLKDLAIISVVSIVGLLYMEPAFFIMAMLGTHMAYGLLFAGKNS